MIHHVKAFEHFVKSESFSGILLFIVTLAAVMVANSALSQAYFEIWDMPLGVKLGEHEIVMDLAHWINDGLMSLFFLMVGLEIKRELLVGELSSIKKASFPIVAAVGGMLIPALVFILINPDNPKGFGVPMATDIAFALGILMLLGKKVNPALKLFLVALAVADDLGAVLVVATVYTNEIHSEYFVHLALVYSLIWALNFKKVTTLLPFLILGIALWIFIHFIGIHATIAGVLLAFAIPIGSKVDEKKFIQSTKESINTFEKNMDEIPLLNHYQIDALEEIAYNYDKVQNPLLKLEHQLHGLSAFVIMPIFAFANAGVILDFTAVSQNLMIVLGVVLGLLVGKPVGIVGFAFVAHKLKIAPKPDNLSWNEVVAVGFIAGIGFTMSIFITQLAFMDESLIAAVKLGIFFASFIAGVLGVMFVLRAHKRKQV